MLKVAFDDRKHVANGLYQYAVIVSRYGGQWVFCKHKARATWEIPGGRRERGEAILDTAERELREETGAADFVLTPVCAYSVTRDTAVSYGLLCFAEIKILGALPETEIERIGLFDALPDALTYPQIQPLLFDAARRFADA